VTTRIGSRRPSTLVGMEQELTDVRDRDDAEATTLDAQVLDEQLIEEISIDGMCGVY
jgi:mycofactocin precursor